MNTEANLTAHSLQPRAAIIHYGYLSDFSTGSLFDVLDAREKNRVDKFHWKESSSQYICCRAILKLLLAQYLDVDVVDIHLNSSPNGKPMLPGMCAIHFNVSHCRDIMLWGISNGNVIGVDVEHLENQIPLGVPPSVCSESELNKIQSLPDHLRHESFINCWTRKEAVLKAVGSRSFPLQQIEVSMLRDEKAEVLATPWQERGKDQWLLESLDLAGNYRGAVAIKGKPSHLDINRLNGTPSPSKHTTSRSHSHSSIQFRS